MAVKSFKVHAPIFLKYDYEYGFPNENVGHVITTIAISASK
jgi:hypothetical protein